MRQYGLECKEHRPDLKPNTKELIKHAARAQPLSNRVQCQAVRVAEQSLRLCRTLRDSHRGVEAF